MTSYDQRGQSVYGDQYNVAGDLVVHGALQITTPAPLSPAEKQTRRDLGLLLNKVRNAWIEGFLERSIHAEALLDVGQTVDPTAVEHPWERVVELPGQAAHPLPPSQPIGTTFAAMERAMLILGEPGSGKTITLLELARELLDQVEASGTFHQPVPVVFNLSAWPGGQPLFDWLVAELSHKYQIPKRIGRAWLEQHRLLPLLDGLDEVRSADRAACVAAINTFGQEYGLAGLAVCSRLDEYTALPIRLKLNGAIRLQPLTAAQVDEYLAHLGPAMDPLRQTLQADQPLRELAQAPLMLNIMSLAYRDEAAQPVQPLATVEARRAHLFNTYIQKMFTRKGKREKPCTDEQMTAYVSRLAQAMRQQGQAIFFIEQIERGWLASPAQKIAFSLMAVILIGAVLGGVVFQAVDLMATEILGQGELAWLGGSLAGVGGGLWLGWRKTTFNQYVGRAWRRDLPRLTARLTAGLVAGGLAGFLLGLGLVIVLDLLNILNLGMTRNIPELLHDGPNAVQLLGLDIAFFGAIVGSFIGLGLGNMVSGQVETMTKPGQLLAEAGRNVVIGAVVGGSYGLALGFFLMGYIIVRYHYGEFYREDIYLGLEYGWVLAWDFGLLLALLFGGASLIKHGLLRVLLALTERLPLHLTRFLDHATDLIFLRKVGGGYIFIHRLLLEHFAQMPPKPEAQR